MHRFILANLFVLFGAILYR